MSEAETTGQSPVTKTEEQSSNYKPNFLNRLDTVSNNGFYFNGVCLPQELVVYLFTYLEGKELLKTSLVCRNWFNVVRSRALWKTNFKRRFKKKPKKVPWYVYYAYFNHGLFDRNLVKNGNGQEKMKHWNIVRLTGSRLKVEVPAGTEALPTNVEEFSGQKSYFVMSNKPSIHLQRIELAPLSRYILDTHKPHIYVSEWIASKFPCTYILNCRLDGKDEEDVPPLAENSKNVEIENAEGKDWSKVDMSICDYPEGVEKIVFEHVGRNFGAESELKIGGAVVKILFDTVKEVANDEDEAEIESNKLQ